MYVLSEANYVGIGLSVGASFSNLGNLRYLRPVRCCTSLSAIYIPNSALVALAHLRVTERNTM